MRAAIKRFELQCNAEPAQLPKIFKKSIASTRCLFVIANVVHREQIIAILQHLGPHCNALITSRQIPQSASQLILTHDLWQLSHENTIALLKAWMGERKVSSRYTAEIVRDLGKLPLAIVMAGNFLGTRPDFPIDIFIQQLKKGGRLSLLNRIAGRGDPNVEAVLRISLEATSAERASRWRSLAVFPSAIDPHAAQAIWKMSSAEEARHELSEMTACSLLLHDGKRHFMHELMSDIARSDLKRSPVK